MKSTNATLLSIATIICGAILALGNSSGAASNGNYYTGAPTPGGGQELTCSTCHNSGTYGEPQLDVRFADEGSEEFATLTEYEPGKTYRVSVAVGYQDTKPEGYGFQAQFLDKATSPATAGTLSVGDMDTRVDDQRDGRVYVEQNNPNGDSLYIFNWAAPAAGAGPVDMYVVGNLVNRAEGTGGDNGSTMPTIVALTEAPLSGLNDFEKIDSRIYPNPTPTGGVTVLKTALAVGGRYHLQLFDLTGGLLQERGMDLPAGPARLEIPTSGLAAGTYFVSLTGRGARAQAKVVVL